MKRSILDRATQATQLLGGSLCAVLGLRLMVLAILDARARQAPAAVAADSSASAAAAPVGAGLPRARARHVPAPERHAADGSSVRLMLSVVAGPERSEVYVNGSRLGLSPYLGDYTCKHGEELRIDVVPTHEALISRSATCEGQTLWIR
jgi:hypothetical protein